MITFGMSPYELSRVVLHACQVIATFSIPFAAVLFADWLKRRRSRQKLEVNKYKYKYKYSIVDDHIKGDLKKKVETVFDFDKDED